MLRSVCLLGASSLASAQDTPGFQFMGYGYDLLYGNPRSTQGSGDPGFRTNVFTFTHNDGQMTTDGKWKVPDKTTSQDFGGTCTTEQSRNIIASAYEYQQAVDDGVSLSAGFMGLDFSLSMDFKNVDNQTRSNSSVFAQVNVECAAYELTMHTYDHPPVDPNFLAGVASLPETYDEDAYMTFLRNFGTHVVTQLNVGGRWGWQMTFSHSSYTNMLDNSVNVGMGIEFAGKIRAGFKFNHSSSMKDYMSVVNSISRNSTFNIGGKFTPDMSEWMTSVKDKPMPTHLNLMPLDKILSPMYIPNASASALAAKASAMRDSIKGYCSWVQKNLDSKATCKPPEPLPEPQPKPVSETAVRRVCVLNNGGFAMNWELNDISSQYPVKAGTDKYAHGETDCLDGSQVGADAGDKLNCRANVVGGKSQDCEGGSFTYDPRAKKQADFECTGSTYTVRCTFTGLSPYGAKERVREAIAEPSKAVEVLI